MTVAFRDEPIIPLPTNVPLQKIPINIKINKKRSDK